MDVSVHRPGRGGDTRNHHAHLLCTTRRLTADGFKGKTHELDDLKTGEVVFWRERWATLTNERLRDRGVQARVDHRTLEAPGIERTPTVHKGPLLVALERRGIEPRVSRRPQEEGALEVQLRLERAAELGRLKRECAELDRSILVLSTDIAPACRERDRASTPELDRWREEARRAREAAKEKSKDRESGSDHDRKKDRDGPDYER